MTSLITGGLGFIGSHLARQLVKTGETVVLYDIAPRSCLIDDFRDKAIVFRGDLDNWVQVLEAVRTNHVDTIYHCGALLSAAAEESPLATYKVNGNGTFHIMEVARLLGVKTVLYLSTIASFGPGLGALVSDDDIQRPITMYGVTKVFGERLGEYYHNRFATNFRGVRLPSVIGPGRGPGGASAYSSMVVQEAAAGRPYEMVVREETRMPLIYIKDAVAAMVQLARADGRKLKRRVYNVQGFSPTAKELAEAVRAHIKDADITFRPQPDMVKIVESWPQELDDTNAENDWGWKTEYLLQSAVHDFTDEFRAHRAIYGP